MALYIYTIFTRSIKTKLSKFHVNRVDKIESNYIIVGLYFYE